MDFVDQAGKRRHKQFKRKKDADTYLAKARGQVADGTYTAERGSKTIREAAELWIERAKAEKLERSTIEQYERHRDHILAAINGDTKLAKLTKARCEQLRDDLLKAHSRAMARNILRDFKSILKDAMRRSLIAQNVAAATEIKQGKRHQKRLEVGVPGTDRGDIPQPDEIKAIIEASVRPKALAIVCLAAYAGLRAGELRGLPWTDLDLGNNPRVTVSQRADRWGEIGPPKSAASQRTVPLDEITVAALKAWKFAQPPIVYEQDGEKRQRPATLVFGTSADKPDMLGNLQRRVLDPVQVRAGIKMHKTKNGEPIIGREGQPIWKGKYSFHKLRHHAISTWLRACQGDFKVAQTWAGHETLALTLDRYGHLIPRKDEHEIMAAAVRGDF